MLPPNDGYVLWASPPALPNSLGSISEIYLRRRDCFPPNQHEPGGALRRSGGLSTGTGRSSLAVTILPRNCWADCRRAATGDWLMKPTTIAAGLFAVFLPGCVTPVVLRDPVSGEVAQCLATGAFPLLNQQQCVASRENLGWIRTTGAEAQQAQRQRIAGRDAEIAAAGQECREARIRGELKTHVASIQCSTPRVRAAYQRAGYPYMDLIDVASAVRLADAEKIDNHQMTEVEASLHIAQVFSQITDQERRRGFETKAVEIQAQSAQTQAEAVEVQARAAQSQANAAQEQLRLQQEQLLQLQMQPRNRSFSCYTSGNTTNCN
jgi:hypothetical protein